MWWYAFWITGRLDGSPVVMKPHQGFPNPRIEHKIWLHSARSRSLTRLLWEDAFRSILCGHCHQPSVLCLCVSRSCFLQLWLNLFCHLSCGPEPADNPVAAEPAVPPTEPEVENEVIASLIPCVLHPVLRILCQRFPCLVALSLFVCVGFVPLSFIAQFRLICQDGIRLHLGHLPFHVGFAFARLFYFLPRYIFFV